MKYLKYIPLFGVIWFKGFDDGKKLSGWDKATFYMIYQQICGFLMVVAFVETIEYLIK